MRHIRDVIKRSFRCSIELCAALVIPPLTHRKTNLASLSLYVVQIIVVRCLRIWDLTKFAYCRMYLLEGNHIACDSLTYIGSIASLVFIFEITFLLARSLLNFTEVYPYTKC